MESFTRFHVSFFVLLALCYFANSASGLREKSPWPKHLYDKYRAPWEIAGPANENEIVEFWVTLKQRNLDQLEEISERVSNPKSPEYGNYQTIDEILNLIAPPVEEHDKVVEWLNSEGGVVNLISYRDALHVEMLAKNAERLLKTKFFVFSHPTKGVKVIRQLNGFSLPDHIKQHIDFVSGLTELPYLKERKIQKLSQEDLRADGYKYIIPESVRKVYNIPDGTYCTNSKSSQCAMEFYPETGPIFTDLEEFAKQAQEPFTNISRIVGNYRQGGFDSESVLDVELITNVAPKAINWYWTIKNGWAYEMALQLFNQPDAPLVNSVSYGWPEEFTCQAAVTHAQCNGTNAQQYVGRANAELLKLTVRGLSVLVATQDEGAPSEANIECEDQSHPVYAIYPSSSPYVTAVSGTTLIPRTQGELNVAAPPICQNHPCGFDGTEVPCESNNTLFRWTTGGGFSAYGQRPKYQDKAVSNWFSSSAMRPPTSLFPSSNRGYADVSAFGSRILIVSGGIISSSAGTSAATPIFAAVVTLLNDYRLNNNKKPLGFLNPLFYQMAEEQQNSFNDITTGDNRCTIGTCCQYGYGATKGWDPVTGLGSPDFLKMKEYISKLP